MPNEDDVVARAQAYQWLVRHLNQKLVPHGPIERIMEYMDPLEEQVAASDRLHEGRINDNTIYLIGYLSIQNRPILGAFRVARLVITVTSRDQGWSSYPVDQGTRRNSHTFVEMELRGSPQRPTTYPRTRVVTNIHAGRNWEATERVFEEDSDEVQWLQGELDRNGSLNVDLFARSQYPGWRCKIQSASVRVFWRPI